LTVRNKSYLVCFFALILAYSSAMAQLREVVSLNSNWKTIASDKDSLTFGDLYVSHDDAGWKTVNIPHNWDGYDGYRRLLHGNRHGNSWYKKHFTVSHPKGQRRFFLFFEGVGSYATVYLNGKLVGEHAGGRTSFTIDVTDVINTTGKANMLAVRAWHPSGIKDLPWVCGGCSDERGFSEGSQPMGIFRPVQLIITGNVRIEPFGVHVWADVKHPDATLHITNTVKNYSEREKRIRVINKLVDQKGKKLFETSVTNTLQPGDSIDIRPKSIELLFPQLWSPSNPYLYKIISQLEEDGGRIVDEMETPFGFRTINWRNATNQFFINGQPVFINGVAEYEHLIGQSHAFTPEQINSRFKWIKAAGFNAFRDGHQPHNLLYGKYCNEQGILWWTQLSAHVWYDSPGFRDNFKKLLREWVIERRNDPSVVLWGLQNESKLPEDFAKECTELIRQLDPTTSSQRLVTTCNGGSGTDWDVPQNWTGTYGGNPDTYASDIKKQVLIGEYGAWRTLDMHTEGGFVQNGALSEDRMTLLMEQKVRLAESVKDSCAGQFFWLLTSHDNPGRVQGGEGLRELDRIGPVNYKGMLTPWEEPADVYYMFRSNYASKETSPMVYIASHTWPSRWTTPGKKDGINVYSNCDEVELFNDIGFSSLGKQKRRGIGTHFQWNSVDIRYNVLYAVGYVNGKEMARDTIVLNHLPRSPHFDALFRTAKPITKPAAGYNYIYRVNCGGPEYKDEFGNIWAADVTVDKSKAKWGGAKMFWHSASWTDQFAELPDFFASQRRTFDPIKGAKDWRLFQDFRYGKDQLAYEFPLPAGEYLVELYFIEPWLGIGGGVDASGMRLFDVAIDGRTVWNDIDIWKEAGTNTAHKKTTTIKTKGGIARISFPQSKSGQALISAIAIASRSKSIKPAPSRGVIYNLEQGNVVIGSAMRSWIDIGDRIFSDSNIHIKTLPPALFGGEWLQLSNKLWRGHFRFGVTRATDVYVAVNTDTLPGQWLKGFEDTKTVIETDAATHNQYKVYRKRFNVGDIISSFGGTREFPLPIIIACPVATIPPAFDLKTVTPYRANVAVVSSGVVKEDFAGRECAVIKSKDNVTIEWPIQTGVADVYAITVKYFYGSEQPIKGTIQLIGAGGTMMLNEPVSFTFTRAGKWNQFTFDTKSMINAGNYKVKLVIENAEGLAISGIEVQ
jgi:beta-galactosidase